MKDVCLIGLRIAVGVYASLHFFTSIVDHSLSIHLLSWSGIAIVLFSLLSGSLSRYKLQVTILIIAFLVMYFSETPILQGSINGILQMREMVGLLAIIPLISWVLREEPYIEDIMAYFHRFITSSQRFYFGIVSFTQIIAYFLLFGSISVMYQFIKVILKDQTSEAWENYKGTAILRGFSLSTLWVISIPSFIFAVETLDATLWIVILQGFLIALVATFLATTFSALQEKTYGVNLSPILMKRLDVLLEHASPPKIQRRKVIEFITLFVTLFGSIFLIHSLFHVKLMLAIPIVIVVWTIAFYIYKRRFTRLFYVIKMYVKDDLPNQSYQILLMLSVGLLIFSLNQTSFAKHFVNSLSNVQNFLPFLNVLYLLPFILIILGFAGLGPMTVMVLVAGILEQMPIAFPPELVVLAITSGSAISIMLSPLVMPVIMLSAANGLSLWKNGIKFNYKFAISLYVLVQIYIQFVVNFWL